MGTLPLSSDQMRKYAALWKRYGTKPFEFRQALNLLRKSENHTLVTLHRLKAKGWLTAKQHPKNAKNAKKTLYSLIPPNDAVKAVAT